MEKGLTMERSISLIQVIHDFSLRVMTAEETVRDRYIRIGEINRPSLQLAGFYEYFDPQRVQIIGKVEYSYLASMTHEKRVEVFETFFATRPTCLIFCRGLGEAVDESMVPIANKYQVPVLESQEVTTQFTVKLIHYLVEALAPRISMHGVMVDVFGEGVLILGESGVGKSETALELIKRGHRLVADDVVEIHQSADNKLMAKSADLIQNMIELRGVGVVNVKELYGVQSVRINKSIDMVVRLEAWSPEKQYDRIGLETATMDILGNQVALYAIPIMVGRNLSVIVETAALNHREKKMGYNAAEELRDRVNNNIKARKIQKDPTVKGGEFK